jgi:hypothetical protein
MNSPKSTRSKKPALPLLAWLSLRAPDPATGSSPSSCRAVRLLDEASAALLEVPRPSIQMGDWTVQLSQYGVEHRLSCSSTQHFTVMTIELRRILVFDTLLTKR